MADPGGSRRGDPRRGILSLSLCGICAGLLLAELVLGKLQTTPNFVTYSPSRGWRLRPGARGWHTREGRAYVVINRDGLRGPPLERAKPPAAIRIAVLGDSFVEAIHVPYEKSFCALLGRELGARCPALKGRRVETLCFGVSGYGTAQEYLLEKEEIWRYSPDAVVLAVFTGNDLTDNSRELDPSSFFEGERCRPYFDCRDGRLESAAPFAGRGLFALFCKANLKARRFALVRLLGTAAEALLRRGAVRPGDKAVPGSEAGISDRIYAAPSDPAWTRAWELTERLIEAVADESRGRQARFLAVTLSNPVQVYPDKAFRERYLRAVGGTDIFYPEHRLRSVGNAHGFPVLSLAPAMQAAADREGVFFHGFPNTRPGVGHWNELGHAFAAREISRALCGQFSR